MYKRQGDIPTFEKTEEHEEVEKRAVDELLQSLPGPLYQEITVLFEEMDAQETKEARVYKAVSYTHLILWWHPAHTG